MAIFDSADAVVTHFLFEFIHQNSPICRPDYVKCHIIIFWDCWSLTIFWIIQPI